MKKILIVNNNMHIGGVQKALLNLLCEAEKDVDITLLLFYKGGKLIAKIPKNIEVIQTDSLFKYIGMTKNDATNAKSKILRSFFALITMFFGRDFVLRLMYPSQKEIDGYDVAISFLHSGEKHMFYGGCNEFVLNCVNASKKITFLHCDFEKINANSKSNQKIYEQFDEIAACSDGCRKSFLNVVPQCADRTIVVKNCINYSEVRKMAQNEPVTLQEGKINIVTVSRFGNEKGILRAIKACIEVGNGRKDFRYYIIGNGTDFYYAKTVIKEYNVEDNIVLLGEMENPYGYIAVADFLLIPSVSEAAPMVIGEAACLGTPILTTKTSSAVEMVEETGIGWVCDNSEEGILTGIKYLLDNPCEIEKKKAFIKEQNFDDNEALEQFSKLVS